MGNHPLRIAAFTMCYKEHVMLPLWIKHYEQLVGRENLFILDHSNDPPIQINDIKCEVIARPNYDEVTRLNTIKTWQNKLLETYDWVIFSDTDEFIVFRQSPNTTIQDYLKQHQSQIIRCIGVEVYDTGDVPPVNWGLPILEQRHKGAISNWSCKSLISSTANDWTPGFHTTNSTSTADYNFWLFHLKHADEAHLMQRLSMTRQFDWSEDSIRSGFGGSHRIPDFVMKYHLKTIRKKQADGTLDDFLKNSPDLDTISSPLMDIPKDFLPLL